MTKHLTYNIPTIDDIFKEILEAVDPKTLRVDPSKFTVLYKWKTFFDKDQNKITVRRTWGIEIINPISCKEGNFYDKISGECLGKSFTQYIYFYDNETELDFPKLVPEATWKAD